MLRLSRGERARQQAQRGWTSLTLGDAGSGGTLVRCEQEGQRGGLGKAAMEAEPRVGG